MDCDYMEKMETIDEESNPLTSLSGIIVTVNDVSTSEIGL